MPNLPFTLPACDQPATIRIDVYSPDGSAAYGSLDAGVYSCQRHILAVESAIWRAKLTPNSAPLAPDIERACGHVYVFPTGSFGGLSPSPPSGQDRPGH